MEFDYSAGDVVPVVEVCAEDITSGDTFPSHDGCAHYVEGVCVDAETVTVNVHPIGREPYSAEFSVGDTVRVLA